MKSQTFGEKLKELRLNLKYSLKFVGEEIGYSPRFLSQVEQNKKTVPENIIPTLAKLYHVSHKELFRKYLTEKLYYQIRSFDGAIEVLDTVRKRVEKEGKGTQKEESRVLILESIRTYFADKPIEKAWIFGSFARSTQVSRDSDIDIMVTFKKAHKISLFDLIQMKEELTRQTGREVDLVEEGQELKPFRETIRKERLLVYGD